MFIISNLHSKSSINKQKSNKIIQPMGLFAAYAQFRKKSHPLSVLFFCLCDK